MREGDCGAGLVGGITFLILALVMLGLVRIIQFLSRRIWHGSPGDPGDQSGQD